jgi:hypothetical protein
MGEADGSPENGQQHPQPGELSDVGHYHGRSSNIQSPVMTEGRRPQNGTQEGLVSLLSIVDDPANKFENENSNKQSFGINSTVYPTQTGSRRIDLSRKRRKLSPESQSYENHVVMTVDDGEEKSVGALNVYAEDVIPTCGPSVQLPNLEAAPQEIPIDDSVIIAGTHKTPEIQSVLQDAGSSTPARTPPKKMMKLRTDGKLFSPPKAQEDRPSKSKRGRKSSATKKEKIVVFTYGPSVDTRHRIGETIAQILDGTTRFDKAPSKVSQQEARPTQTLSTTPKKTHPFFLSRPAAVSNAAAEQRNEQSTMTKHLPLTIKSVTPKKRLFEESSNSSKSWPNFTASSDSNKFPRFPNSIEPLWPTHEMTHVRGQPISVSHPDFQGSAIKQRTARKLKGPEILLSANEDVLRPIQQLVNHASLGEWIMDGTSQFRQPQRMVKSKLEIKNSLAEELSTELPGYPKTPYHRRLGSSSPAVLKLFNNLDSASSAFDRFECETQDWVVKYSPKCVEDILQPTEQMNLLRDWLIGSAVNSVDCKGISAPKEKPKSKKKRKKASELDDFIVTTDEEEISSAYEFEGPNHPSMEGYTFRKVVPRYMPLAQIRKLTVHSLRSTKAVVISGPHGCGKTASVYAVAQDAGFEVFEINSGSRRSGKDLLERIGDMTKNHLVNQDVTASEEDEDKEKEIEESAVQEEIQTGKQSTMASFFNIKRPIKKDVPQAPKAKKAATSTQKKVKPQKQSLILLEEVDVLFEEDKQFWNTVVSLLATSKRPIIMTCTDESFLPSAELDSCSMLRLAAPQNNLAIDYLLLIAAHEGHLLSRESVSQLYASNHSDLRASIMQLNFWCQMAIKDSKGGLDWMLLRPYTDFTPASEIPRVLSNETFQPFMGMLSTNESLLHNTRLDREFSSMSEAALEWQYYTWDWLDWLDGDIIVEPRNAQERRDQLKTLDIALESMSASDILPGSGLLYETTFDSGYPDLTERSRAIGFTEYPKLLQTSHLQDATRVSEDISSTLRVCSYNVGLKPFQQEISIDRSSLCQKIINRKKPLSDHYQFIQATMQTGLDPVLETRETTKSILATEIAPYVRSIVSYDIRLEHDRLRLSGLLSEGGRNGKKQRTTRASRAALEGGSKAYTRRERWFDTSLNLPLILETGGQNWQVIAQHRLERDLYTMNAMESNIIEGVNNEF